MNQQTRLVYGVYLTPILGLTELCQDARYDGAIPAENDGKMQINVFFKNPDMESLNISENHSLRLALEANENFKVTVDLKPQPYLVFIYNVPDEFEQDIYYFCAGQINKISQLFQDKVTAMFPDAAATFNM